MKNTADISTDGINVYATMRVKPRKIAVVILSAVVLILTTLFILFVVFVFDENDVNGSILPTLILFACLCCFRVVTWFGIYSVRKVL